MHTQLHTHSNSHTVPFNHLLLFMFTVTCTAGGGKILPLATHTHTHAHTNTHTSSVEWPVLSVISVLACHTCLSSAACVPECWQISQSVSVCQSSNSVYFLVHTLIHFSGIPCWAHLSATSRSPTSWSGLRPHYQRIVNKKIRRKSHRWSQMPIDIHISAETNTTAWLLIQVQRHAIRRHTVEIVVAVRRSLNHDINSAQRLME